MKTLKMTPSTVHFTTTDYSNIISVTGNRKLKRHLSKIKTSIKDLGNISTGVVAMVKVGKEVFYYLLDGQHRFDVCQHLKIPFEYKLIEIKKDKTLMEYIIALNTNSDSWKSSDYLKSEIDRGNINYIQYEEILKSSSWTVKNAKGKTVTKYLGIDSLNKVLDVSNEAFKQGKLIIENFEAAKNIVKYVVELKPFLPTGAQCQRSIVSLVKSPNYNHAVMLGYCSTKPLDTWSTKESVLKEDLKDALNRLLKNNSKNDLLAALKSDLNSTKKQNKVTKNFAVSF